MTNVIKRVRWALPVGAAVLSLAACTAQTTGSPSGTAENSGSASSAPATTGSSANSGVAGLNACDLLTAEEVVQFKAQGPGKAQDTQTSGATSACGWLGRSSTDRSVSFAVLVRGSQGIDELQSQAQTSGGTVTNGSLNGREARQASLASGGCILALKVGKDSRVDLSVVIGGVTDPTEACQIASKLGNIVEPKLPPEAN
jgi:hypothetical protein